MPTNAPILSTLHLMMLTCQKKKPKVILVGKNCLLASHTSKCGHGIRLTVSLSRSNGNTNPNILLGPRSLGNPGGHS